MKRTLFVATLSLAAVLASIETTKGWVPPVRDDDDRFMISMLRADGTLVPFAQYGNGGWWNPWPKLSGSAESIYAKETEPTYHSLADLPEPWFKQCGKIPTNWYFWSPDGTLSVLKASNVLQVNAHSGTNWALLTDFSKETAREGFDNNVGVTANVSQRIEPVIEIKTAKAEWGDIGSFIKEVFDQDESAELDRLRAESPPRSEISSLPAFSLSREERGRVTMSITKLYRSSSVVNGEHLYYFEAEKEYQNPAPSKNQGCNDVSLFQGWISTMGKGGMGLLAGQVTLTDCDRKGPDTVTPFGIMKIDNRVFLFVTEHGWESESYLILELNNSGLHRVLETVGG
jgi:hypothetical protein